MTDKTTARLIARFPLNGSDTMAVGGYDIMIVETVDRKETVGYVVFDWGSNRPIRTTSRLGEAIELCLSNNGFGQFKISKTRI